MEKKKTLRELLEKEQVFAPCIWDCVTARSAELCGFGATVLSSGALAWSMLGMPDLGLLTVDEVVFATERIAQFSSIPLIIDAEDGYGESPIHTYRTVSRLAKAGAMAVMIDDTTGIRGWERQLYQDTRLYETIPEKNWLAKLDAAMAACEGTDCMLIARTEAKFKSGLDAAINRCLSAHALGAPMTLAIGIQGVADATAVSERVPGWKMYPDVKSKNGVTDIDLQTAARLGFNLVTMHYMEKAVEFGLMLYGLENCKNGSTVFSDSHDMGGVGPACRGKFSTYKHWLDMEQKFLNRQ